MTRGLLIIDQCMNTLILPWDDEDFSYWLRNHKDRECTIKRHDTLKELDKDVRAYLKNEYEERTDENEEK